MHSTSPNIGAPSRDDSEKRRPSMRGQRACTVRVHALGGAPPCAAAIPVRNFDSVFVSILTNRMLDTIMAIHCGRYRQSGPRPEPRLLCQPALEALTNSARTDSPRKTRPERFPAKRWRRRAAHGGGVRDTASREPTTIAAPESQFRTCPTDHGKASSNITTICKSRVSIDPIAMRTSWRSNSDIASATSIGYPRMSASGESSTTMHRLLHASGSHPIPPPDDPKTNQYNQDLGLIHSTNGNNLESPNEGSSIDHQAALELIYASSPRCTALVHSYSCSVLSCYCLLLYASICFSTLQTVNSDLGQSTQLVDSQLRSGTVNSAGQQSTQLWKNQLSSQHTQTDHACRSHIGINSQTSGSCYTRTDQIRTDVSVVIWVYGIFRTLSYKCQRQRFDKLERRRGMHCFVSADEDFSRLFVEVVQQLLSLFVEESYTTAFDLVGTTAYWLRVFSRRISRWKNAYAFQQRILLSVFPVEVLDNEDIDRRISQLVEAKKEHKSNQVALEASHTTIAGLAEIGLCMSKKIERMKAKKQQARESHMECHQRLQSRIQLTESLQEENVVPFDDEWEEESDEEGIEEIPVDEGEIVTE
ncbi:hypothetical protein F511_38710 [Dorcoceras hygrometricum]|uniref:Uncharacterized protein n=1 Tax=Dorcoceras hygrometricum TaxID=472368 RepID=A0A2Z7BDQ7_9LAMI|nr:hypothetical protein F511_38710 [Dorcoceras hygrometricum]